MEASRTRVIASQKPRRFARLAQIPFDYAQGRLSLRKRGLLGMTRELRCYTDASSV